jgi:uncharacterized membrane-anchored protein
VSKLHIEVWNSDNNRHEQHYFLKDGQNHAYQNAEYLFGVNPRYFNDEKISLILAMLEDVCS